MLQLRFPEGHSRLRLRIGTCWSVRSTANGAQVLRLRGGPRQLPPLLAEAIEPAHRQLVAERGSLRRAIEGREPGTVVREVDRRDSGQPAHDAGAVAEEPQPQASGVESGAE